MEQFEINTENFKLVLSKLKALHNLNAFSYEVIDKINVLCKQSILYQIKELCKDMPCNGHIELSYDGYYSTVYVDNNLKLGCCLFECDSKYSFECNNILEVQNKGKTLLDVNCIVSTQKQLMDRVNKLLTVVNEEIEKQMDKDNKTIGGRDQ